MQRANLPIRFFVILGLISLTWGCSVSQQHPSSEAASKGVETFKLLVDEDNFRQMGFESLEEVDNIELAEFIPVATLSLNKLKTFKKGDLPASLVDNYEPGDGRDALVDKVDEVIYPVLVDGEVRSSLVVTRGRDGWQVTSYGDDAFVKAMREVEDTIIADKELTYSDFSVAEVPAMYVAFTAYREDETLMLTPIYDSQEYDFKAGKTEPGEDLLVKLSDFAQDYDGSILERRSSENRN